MGSIVRQGFWSTDWFAGLFVGVVLFFAWNGGLLRGLESTAYDMGVRLSSRAPSDRIAVIGVDHRSIENLGRWPLPRDAYARLLATLREGEAKVVGIADPLVEPQRDPGLAYITDLEDFYLRSNMARSVPTEIRRIDQALISAANFSRANGTKASRDGTALKQLHQLFSQSSLAGELEQEIEILGNKLAVAAAALNPDRQLAKSMRAAGNTVLGMTFAGAHSAAATAAHEPSQYVLRNRLLNVVDRIGAVDRHWFPPAPVTAAAPIPELAAAAAGIGHHSYGGGLSQSSRVEPLVALYQDTYIPSLALHLAAKSLDLGLDEIRVLLGEGVQLGSVTVDTDSKLRMHTFYYGHEDGRAPFPVASAQDVLTGRIPADSYRDKIVLVGTTTSGLNPAQATPVSAAMPAVVALAHSVSTLLNGDFFVVPGWHVWAEYGVFLLIMLFLMLAFPHLNARLGATLTVVLLVALPATQLVLMASQAVVLQLMAPASLLVVGSLVLAAKRSLLPAPSALKSEAGSAESNRMLGLAFQGQGQLDMAFEKFRQCQLDDSIMDLLYNLGLDFERKRQFAKAVSVYQYMCSHNSKYRDIEQRMTRTRALEETVMFGALGVAPTPGLHIAAGGVEKPMLGRYLVEKELGKGAMGVVYLGRDPKLNRIVAIKTMALSQEFDGDELEDVKARFFREAETAGRLTHPNIVTIYDAGEEHDLAYIAMEFLDGEDMVPYTKPESLLPLRTAIELMAEAAEALDYAHARNVVHRDIKPANLMYEASTGTMKITDFGIARITDANKTKTGMVLGTPSYMSPEQLAGQKVDGRSDLFSLAVMMFQLLTGCLPFQGDSMATLMLKIANDDHPDVTSLRTGVPACIKPILDKALNKDRNKRYQRGQEMAQDLRACVANIPVQAGNGV